MQGKCHCVRLGFAAGNGDARNARHRHRIGSVNAMVALGTGAQKSVQDRIAKLGTTLLQVNAQRVAQGGALRYE